MRKFLITNPKFTGEAQLYYDETGRLIKMDVWETNMSAELIAHFKKSIPSLIGKMFDASGFTSDTNIVEGYMDVTLDDFKIEYPYQRNMHLLPALWDRLNMDTKIILVIAAKKYRKYCLRNESWGYKPMIAATWIKQGEYLNDWDKL